MNRTQLIEIHQQMTSAALETMKKKNEDYADSAEVFGNLLLCEDMDLCSKETGTLVRVSDKLKRLVNLVGKGKTPQVTDESVRDTVEDMINYLILLYAMCFERQRGEALDEMTRLGQEIEHSPGASCCKEDDDHLEPPSFANRRYPRQVGP